MTPTVLREGEPRSIMVLNAAYMCIFAQPESREIEAAREYIIYTIAHESAHVHDLDVRSSSIPDAILKTQLGFKDGILFYIASGCWEEYIACRLSAFVSKEQTLRSLEDTFCSALQAARGRANAAIRQYRMHHDVRRATEEVGEEYKRVLVYASYLLGHVDGSDRAIQEAAPKATAAVAGEEYFKPFFSKLHEALKALHSTYGKWSGFEVYETLKQLADELLKIGGIDLQTRPDGSAHVSIPFTRETMPTVDEQLAFVAAQNAPTRK
jgi:hypothetical protein